MASPAVSTGANATPWFQAFKPANLQTYWEQVSKAYLASPTKGGFSSAFKTATVDWLKSATNLEGYLISEIATTWMGPLGEGVQQGILGWMRNAGIAAAPELLTPAQSLASKFLGYGLFIGAGITAIRGLNRALHHDDNYKEPPRYKKAYSRLHSMEHGAPFFGSGALNDNILKYGRERLDLANTGPMHPLTPVNPSRGGLPQELNRNANTHYLMGAAQYEHNARLFNVM